MPTLNQTVSFPSDVASDIDRFRDVLARTTGARLSRSAAVVSLVRRGLTTLPAPLDLRGSDEGEATATRR